MTGPFLGTDGWYYQVEGNHVRSFHTDSGLVDGHRDMENLMGIEQFRDLATAILGHEFTQARPLVADEGIPAIAPGEWAHVEFAPQATILPEKIRDYLRAAFAKLTSSRVTELFDALPDEVRATVRDWDGLTLEDKRKTLADVQFAQLQQEVASVETDQDSKAV